MSAVWVAVYGALFPVALTVAAVRLVVDAIRAGIGS